MTADHLSGTNDSASARTQGSAELTPSSAKDDSRSGRVRRLLTLTPTVLSYLMAPMALPVIIVLMHFGLIVRRPTWLWVAVFIVVPATTVVADFMYGRRPNQLWLHVRIAQNAAAVTTVIYLTGWGPALVLTFAFIALENIARGGARLWRATMIWSLLGIAAGQAAIWARLEPSILSISKANALAFSGAFVLFFIIRMAGAMTEQKETAEASMRQSEDRFRSLIQNSTDVTMVIDDEGFCTYVSPSIFMMLGIQPGELIGHIAADFVHNEDRCRLRTKIRTTSDAGEGSVSVQFRMPAKDGSLRLVEAVVDDQRNRPSVGGFVANLRDITERSKAARALERSHENFRLLFEQHPHPMWVYDQDTYRFLEVNQCAVKNYGYTRDEFLAMTIMDIRPADAGRRLATFLRTERPNLSYAGIWLHRIKSGDIISVEVTTSALEFGGHHATLVMAQDVTERVRLEQQLRDHALHDALTGLPNRSLLLDRVDRLNAQAKRSGAQTTVLCLNLDKFKLINEAYGRDIGDGLLRAVAERLVDTLRDADTVGRIAADEFVILAVPPALESKPELMGQRVLELIAGQPFNVDVYSLSVTASIGVTSACAEDGAELIRKADVALKLAKAEGGNRSIVFANEMQAAVDERNQLTADMREAVRANQFETYYQPVVNVRTQSVRGVEALVRWRHPTLGLILPARFIALAEETGMIRDIGRMVLRQACAQVKGWQREHPTLTVAVNVSVFQLRTDEFVSDVRNTLAVTGLDPQCLILEVTESILISNPETALEQLKALKLLGVRLAIDDFGTGYSSLSYLRQFPFDIMKIDQSFVAAMLDSPKAATMVRTMLLLARQLNLEVVAEGVELDAQLAKLRKLHCPNVQGYLISRPVDADAATCFLREWSVDRALLPVPFVRALPVPAAS